MRIGFDVSDLATGRADGTTRYTFELAKRLPALAPDVSWLYFAPGPLHKQFAEAGKHKNVQVIVSPWQKYWTQSRLVLDLFRYRPDVLFMPIQQLPLMRPWKMRTVAVVHDLAFHMYGQQTTFKDWALLHAFTAQAAREADAVITVSGATATDVADYYGRTEQVSVIHHGVDVAQFAAKGSGKDLRKKYPKLQAPYILYVGQIQPRKNLERLVGAFERVREKRPDWQLVIAGGHGWLQDSILQRVKRSSAREAIYLPGRVPGELLPALYQEAAVFTLPSLYEGFGMPILEAMAAGVPVVTANVSSMPEVAGKAAVLVDPMSEDSIADGILRADARRERLVNKGLERVEDFSWEETAKETLAVLRG